VNGADWGRLAGFVLPLGVDTFALAAAVGASGAAAKARRRVVGSFVGFETGMPLVGLGLGAPLARLVGSGAQYAAAVVLIAVGGWMLLADEEDEEDKARALVDARGWALAALGLSISVDELAIGFSLGLSRLPVALVIPAIAVQALVAAQLGLLLGARLSERSREAAERVAGVALAALGIFLLVERLLGPA
jgi:putative Mn2+ efflux pump MntP